MRAKHIDAQLHFVKDEIEKEVVALEYCQSREMLADGLTKPLPASVFQEHRRRMGVQEIQDSQKK